MKLELFTKRDLINLDELRPEGWGDIKSPHEYYLSHSFCKPMKLLIDSFTAGVGTTIRHHDTAWLAHIIVHRGYRGRGLGQQMVRFLISELKNDNRIKTVSLIATDLGYPVYIKNGFVLQTEYHFYELQENKSNDIILSPDIFPYDNAMESEILKMDRLVSGEDRSELLREKLSDALVFRINGIVEGFTIPDLGDGLTIAVTNRAGKELLKLIMKRGNRIVIPRENIFAGDFLLKYGYMRGKTARRMINGSAFPWKPENLFNRIGGNFG